MQEHTENEGEEKMKVGDTVRVTVGDRPYFKAGDIAVLERQDRDGDWWARFSNGEEWCLMRDGYEEHTPLATLRDTAPDMLDALENAKLFAKWVLSVSKPEVEMYKHEFQYNASQSIERIEEALGKARGEA